VKVGAYIVADRLFTTHSIRFAPRPELHTTLLGVGSIIRVLLTRETADTQPCTHDYLYQIQRISKTFAGDTQYECRHFPVDSQRRSIVALNVANAFGTGILLTSAKTGVSCDINSSTDNTIPIEEFVIPNFETGLDDIVINGFVVGQIDSPDFGTNIAVGGDLTGIGDSTGIGDFAGLGDFGDIGGGGSFNGGLGAVGENPTDAGDAEPLGPLAPLGGEPGDDPSGVEEFETPEGACPGGKIIYTTADLDSDGNVIDGTIRESERNSFSIPIADFRNFASFSFRVVCPDGEQQYTDPILSGEPDPNNFEYESDTAFSVVFDYERVVVQSSTIDCTFNEPISAGGTSVSGSRFETDANVFGFKYSFSLVSASITCGPSEEAVFAPWAIIYTKTTAEGSWIEARRDQVRSDTYGGGGFAFTESIETSGRKVNLTIGGVSV
jgi:hypothetical protein